MTPLSAPTLPSTACCLPGSRLAADSRIRQQQQKSGQTGTGETGRTENPPQQEQSKNPTELSSSEAKQLRTLRSRDREVRAHEAAHLGAAGQFARGGANFDYTRGPDGRLYATGGEVQIDVAPVSNDPRASLLKARIIRMAALAPATPSPQDQSVAAAAANMASQARAELQQQHAEAREEMQETAHIDPTQANQLRQRLVSAGVVTQQREGTQINLLA